MQRLILLAALAAFLLACQPKSGSSGAQTSGTAATPTASSEKEKSVAEKAGDAALRARKKAEALKAEQDKKANETDAVMDQ